MKILGTSEAIEQPIRYRIGPNGTSVIRAYVCPTQAQAESVLASLLSAGYEVEVTGGPVWRVEGKLESAAGLPGGSEEPVLIWELLANVSEKDLLHSDSSSIRNLNQYEIGFLKDVADGKFEADDILAWINGTAESYPTYWSEFQSDNLQTIYSLTRLLLSGVRSRIVYQPVLRLTMSVLPSYQLSQSFQNVGSVLSNNVLFTSESVPSRLSNIISNTLSSGYNTRSDGVQVYRGWLKCYPTYMASIGRRDQLQQEWQWGEWATLLYNIIT